MQSIHPQLKDVKAATAIQLPHPLSAHEARLLRAGSGRGVDEARVRINRGERGGAR